MLALNRLFGAVYGGEKACANEQVLGERGEIGPCALVEHVLGYRLTK